MEQFYWVSSQLSMKKIAISWSELTEDGEQNLLSTWTLAVLSNTGVGPWTFFYQIESLPWTCNEGEWKECPDIGHFECNINFWWRKLSLQCNALIPAVKDISFKKYQQIQSKHRHYVETVSTNPKKTKTLHWKSINKSKENLHLQGWPQARQAFPPPQPRRSSSQAGRRKVTELIQRQWNKIETFIPTTFARISCIWRHLSLPHPSDGGFGEASSLTWDLNSRTFLNLISIMLISMKVMILLKYYQLFSLFY